MINLQETIERLIADPSMKVDPQWAIEATEMFPAFPLPAALLLQRNPFSVDTPTRRKLQASVMLNCPDRTAIADFADLGSGAWHDFYPAIPPKRHQDTAGTIDDFLNAYGDAASDDDSLIEKLIFSPMPADYFDGIDEPFDPDDPLAIPPELLASIQPSDDAAAEDTPAEEKPKPKRKAQTRKKDTDELDPTPPMPDDEPNLMESLAKIFIKQRRYERALEIISNLSLKYPEKSVYFADQMRFLQKLIINQAHKQQQ